MAPQRQVDGAENRNLLRTIVDGLSGVKSQLTDRLVSVPRILDAQNARLGRPLSEHDLADLTQDTLIVLLKKIDSVAAGPSLEGWIYRVCCFELMNGIRRKRKQPMLVGDATRELAPREQPDPACPAWEYEDLHQGLEKIDANEAAVIRMKYFDDLTFDQIAERLDVSQGTAKTRFYRGIVKLQALLSHRFPEVSRGRSSS